MSTIELNVEVRKTGKTVVRKLRQKSITPAVIYGKGKENLYCAFEEKFAEKMKGQIKENPIYVLKSADSSINGKQVIIKELEVHPVNRRPVHVDFLEVAKGQEVHVTVELKFVGEAKGVKEQGGMFEAVLHSVEVSCPPAKIPSHIDIDVTNLELGASIHVAELSIPEGVKLLTKDDVTVAKVSQSKTSDEASAETEENKEA